MIEILRHWQYNCTTVWHTHHVPHSVVPSSPQRRRPLGGQRLLKTINGMVLSMEQGLFQSQKKETRHVPAL